MFEERQHNACETLATVAMTIRLQPTRVKHTKEAGRFVVTDSRLNERFVVDYVLDYSFDS